MPIATKIYLDMDGVIADFEGKYKELYNVSPEFTRNNKQYRGLFHDFIAGNNFAKLDMLPGAVRLIDYLNTLPMPTEILSSTANVDDHEDMMRQKSFWLNAHNVTFKQNFVPGKRLKKNYATPTSLLIDDTLSNITDWREAGGIAIWHKDVDSTLKLLQMFI